MKLARELYQKIACEKAMIKEGILAHLIQTLMPFWRKEVKNNKSVAEDEYFFISEGIEYSMEPLSFGFYIHFTDRDARRPTICDILRFRQSLGPACTRL